MKNKNLIIGSLALFIMAGCTGLKNNFEEKSFYRIQAGSQMAVQKVPGGKTLMVKRFSIAPEFETNAFVYQLTPTQFATDYYNNFIVSPARMITDAVKEDLWASPLFSPITSQTMEDVRFQLRGKIIAFLGDIQDTKRPKAIVTIRLILEKNIGKSFSPVINKTYTAKINLPAPDPKLLTQGLGTGLSQILDAFYKDLPGSANGLTPLKQLNQ
jgi:uncharacterized lipoprotein YmbA